MGCGAVETVSARRSDIFGILTTGKIKREGANLRIIVRYNRISSTKRLLRTRRAGIRIPAHSQSQTPKQRKTRTHRRSLPSLTHPPTHHKQPQCSFQSIPITCSQKRNRKFPGSALSAAKEPVLPPSTNQIGHIDIDFISTATDITPLSTHLIFATPLRFSR